MSANSFGHLFKMTSFGESHGTALGVLIEGCPAEVFFDMDLLKSHLARRKPGQSSITTSRQEADEPVVLSGVYEERTLGTPICIIVHNTNQKSEDYKVIEKNPRVGHADDTWKVKFGHVDHRGGGRSSGRETLARVIAGAVAQMLVQQIKPDIKVLGFASAIGKFELSEDEAHKVWNQDVDSFKTRFPSSQNEAVVQMLEKAKTEGESYGGIVEVRMKNVPQGLGQPVFHKFKSDLAKAMMSVGATTGFELAEGFGSVEITGQSFHKTPNSSMYGGIRGGITTGEEISFKVAFKPTSSIKDVAKKGRHDPCIVPRAVPVVEAMAWLVLADHLLWQRLDRV